MGPVGKKLIKLLRKAIFHGVHMFMRAMAFLTAPIFSFIYESERSKKLPPLDNELLLKQGTVLATLIRERKV